MTVKPQIIMDNPVGYHNSNLDKSAERLTAAGSYKDLSTICIIPTRGTIHAKVIQSWFSLMSPMNQKFIRMFMIGMEVGEAYNAAITNIINHPDLKNWKYIMTLEDDNMPPPDGLLKLYENMDKFDVIGGLYWTKGEGGQPMIYGNPKMFPKGFQPQVPIPDQLQEANGLGMGFNLFKLDIFKKMPAPWFKTLQEYKEGQGARAYTQDLYFYENASKFGYKFASDNRVKVGHYSAQEDIVW